MGLTRVPAGSNLPTEFNVVVEIPMHGDPVKFEVDKDSGAIFVDRFMSSAMRYPCNYGYIPDTLAADGDPVDVLLISPFAVQPGVVVACRAVGLLAMEDENGDDNKILAVPVERLTPLYGNIHEPKDLHVALLEQIQHFFSHYKDLEHGKFVKVEGFETAEAAHREIELGVANHAREADRKRAG